jgi:MFS family permease
MVFFSLRVIEIGREPWLVGVALAANTVLEIPVMLAFPRLARRFSVERLLVVGALLIVARQVLWSLTESPAPFIVVTTLGGASFALLVVGTASHIASHVPAQLQATSQALFAGAAYGIGSIAGALIAGQVAASSGLAGLYPVATAVGALGALLMIAGITRLRPPAPRASTTAPRGQQGDGRMPTDTGARPR